MGSTAAAHRGAGRIRLLGWALLALASLPAGGATVLVAAAASVEPALGELAPAFERASGHRLAVSAGATGKLTTQVIQGAPFEVLLAADEEHPARLEAEGLVVAGSRFTYASGRLVLWSAQAGQDVAATLRSGRFTHLAIADPATAPYGAAATTVLRRMGMEAAVAPKLVQGESVGQTFAFVRSGAAELGFVALSQLTADSGGSRWLVPEELHPPLRHQAVLLVAGRDAPAARAFLGFLAGEPAREILRRYGYVTP